MADGDDAVICRTRVARGVYNTLFNKQQQVSNELFQPGRMAYLVELESLKGNPLAAPTTVIRSKADCPEADRAGSKASTNDIVINKLTQILFYLRQGSRQTKKKTKKKMAKDGKPAVKQGPAAAPAPAADLDLDIFGDAIDEAGASSAAGPGPTPSTAATGKKPAVKSMATRYFEEDDEAEDAAGGKQPAKAQLYAQDILSKFSDAAGEQGKQVLAEETRKEEVRKKARLEKLASLNGAPTDSYGEYFPGMQDMGMMEYDEEDQDEEKLKKERKLAAYLAKKAGKDPDAAEAAVGAGGGGRSGWRGRDGDGDGGGGGEGGGGGGGGGGSGGGNRKQRRAKQSEDKKFDSDFKAINKVTVYMYPPPGREKIAAHFCDASP